MYFIVLLLDTTHTILFRARAVRDQKPPSRQLVMLLIFNQMPDKSIPHIAEYGSAHSRKLPLKNSCIRIQIRMDSKISW